MTSRSPPVHGRTRPRRCARSCARRSAWRTPRSCSRRSPPTTSRSARSSCRRRSPRRSSCRRHLRQTLARNVDCEQALSFLGGGCWQHHVPAICDEIAARTEFLTPVWGTPSSDHGRNQAWFEFSSQLGELLELDFVGLPVYSWGCAAGHAIRMAARMTGRSEVLIPDADGPRAARRDPHLLRAAGHGRAHRSAHRSPHDRPPARSTSPRSSGALGAAPPRSTSRTRPRSG